MCVSLTKSRITHSKLFAYFLETNIFLPKFLIKCIHRFYFSILNTNDGPVTILDFYDSLLFP